MLGFLLVSARLFCSFIFSRAFSSFFFLFRLLVAHTIFSDAGGGRLELECLSVAVVGRLALVEVPDQVVDGQGVQVLADEVQEQPVADLLPVGQGLEYVIR